MVFCEIAIRELSFRLQSYSDCITHGKLNRRTCSRGQVIRASLTRNRCIQDKISLFSKEGVPISNDRDKLIICLFQEWHKHFNLWSITTFGDRNDQILFLNYS